MSPVSFLLLVLFLFGARKAAVEFGDALAGRFVRIGFGLHSAGSHHHLFNEAGEFRFFGFWLFLTHSRIICGLGRIVKFGLLVCAALVLGFYADCMSNGIGQWILDRIGE